MIRPVVGWFPFLMSHKSIYPLFKSARRTACTTYLCWEVESYIFILPLVVMSVAWLTFTSSLSIHYCLLPLCILHSNSQPHGFCCILCFFFPILKKSLLGTSADHSQETPSDRIHLHLNSIPFLGLYQDDRGRGLCGTPRSRGVLWQTLCLDT